MMEHFDVSQQDVSYHINQIYDDGEHTLHLAIRYVQLTYFWVLHTWAELFTFVSH